MKGKIDVHTPFGIMELSINIILRSWMHLPQEGRRTQQGIYTICSALSLLIIKNIYILFLYILSSSGSVLF
jgi:hypothetical protein